MRKHILQLILLALPLSALAAEPTPAISSEASQADDLATLNYEAQILGIKAKIAQLRADIRKADADQGYGSPVAGGLPPLPSIGTAAAALPSNEPSQSTPVGPQVVMISAFDGRYRAQLELDGKAEAVTVQEGDMVEGGWTVSRISDSSVTLTKGKQVRVVRLP